MAQDEEGFNYKIRSYEDRANRLKAFKQMMVEDPGFATDVREVLLSPQGNGTLSFGRSGPNPLDNPNFAKIKEYLISRSPDDWVSAKEILEATGVEKGNVYFILDKQFADSFESYLRSPKRKFWRLKKEHR